MSSFGTARAGAGIRRRLSHGSLIIVLATLAMSACGSQGANGQAVTIRFAVGLDAQSAPGIAAQQFKTDIEAQSKGSITVQVYYTGDLGSNQDVMNQTVSGTVQIFTGATSFLSSIDPSVTVDQVPYIFASYTQAHKFWDGQVGSEIKAEILRKAGVRVLNAEEFGFHTMLTKRPINKLEDFKGLKVTAANKAQTAWATALGMTPVNLPIGQAYTAIQQGLIDSLDQALDSAVAQKWYEVLPYATDSNDIYSTGLGYVNEKFWQGLPASYQNMIQGEMTKLQASERSSLEKGEAGAQSTMESRGVKFTTISSTERARLRQAVDPIYSEVGTTLGPQAATWLSEWLASPDSKA